VIVELRVDPAPSMSQKQKQSGAAVSADQLQTYRTSLTASQNQFLAALKSSGAAFQVKSASVPNSTGGPLRLIFATPRLQRDSTQCSAIVNPNDQRDAPGKKVHPTLRSSSSRHERRLHSAAGSLRKIPELTPFDTFNEGYEGQGVKVAVIDTGVDWSHPMFGAIRHAQTGVDRRGCRRHENQK